MKSFTNAASLLVAAGVMFFLNTSNVLTGIALVLAAVAFKFGADDVRNLQQRIARLEARIPEPEEKKGAPEAANEQKL